MELSDDIPMALSFQINDLADVRNQNGNTSNQFKVPMSQKNRAILGFPAQTQFTTDLPYKKYAAKVIQEGIEVIPNGFAELQTADESTADLMVLSGNVDFFDLLTKKIYEMGEDFLPYQELWTLSNVVSSQNRTSGMVWPIIDYGKFTGEIDEECDVRNLRPAFYLKTAIELIVAQTGFTASGSLLTDPLYAKLLVAFANDNFEHGTAYSSQTDNYSSSAKKNIPQFCTSEIREGIVTFNNETLDPSGSYNPGTSEYTAQEILTVNALVSYSMEIRDIFSGGSPPSFSVRVDKYSGAVWTTIAENVHVAVDQFVTYQFLDQSISIDTDLAIGEKLRVSFYQNPASNRINGSFYAGSTFKVTNIQQDVIFGQSVQAERIFPDLSQTELLKDTFQRFGIVCSSDNINQTITFANFGDIVKNIPIAPNWTKKMLDQGKQISTRLGNYTRINNMLYKEDSAVPVTYGNSSILVDDQTLQESSTLVESQFSASLNSRFNGMPCALIKKIPDGETDFSISTSPRILIDNKVDLSASGKSVTFTDGVSDSVVAGIVSIPYFIDSSFADSLDWNYLRETYYPDLEEVLHRCKKIVRWFMLSPIDIAQLDLLKPVFLEQESAYFYISKIDSWRNNNPVRVELVKLG